MVKTFSRPFPTVFIPSAGHIRSCASWELQGYLGAGAMVSVRVAVD